MPEAAEGERRSLRSLTELLAGSQLAPRIDQELKQ